MEYLYIALGIIGLGSYGYVFYLGKEYGENKVKKEITQANLEAVGKGIQTADVIQKKQEEIRSGQYDLVNDPDKLL